MQTGKVPRSSIRWLLVGLALSLSLTTPADPQQQVLGSIIGRVHVDRGGPPPQPVLVELQFRGSDIASVYTDSQGTFGFHNLGPNSYAVIINDEQYKPVDLPAVITANSLDPIVIVDVPLVPKESVKSSSATPATAPGANPNMIDVHEYSERFPKPAVKEFEKGLKSDADGKRDDAIRHYQKAVAIAPEFYLAHNNLGSDYVSKSDLPSARKEFERVVQLNQSDAAAYFNLSNVCMLMGQLPQAREYLDEGMRRQPDSALGQFLSGSLNLRLGNSALAEAALNRAIRLDPAMATARLQLVNLLLKEGRKRDAAAQLHEFLSAFPEGTYSVQARQVLNRLESEPSPAQRTP